MPPKTYFSAEQVESLRSYLRELLQNLKQKELAEYLGVTPTYISEFMSGRTGVGQKLRDGLTQRFGEEELDKILRDYRLPMPTSSWTDKDDRYHFAPDVTRKLVEDGVARDSREASRIVGEILFHEGGPPGPPTGEQLYRAAVRLVMQERRPWKLGVGERDVTNDDDDDDE